MINCAPTSFIRGYNPIWYFVDLTGSPFDDTFYLYVLENTIPYIPATVYQDPSGTIPWGFPIQFLANGTLPDNIYFAENHFYRLEIRKNLIPPPTQNDQLIYLIENYNPSNTTTAVVSTMSSTVDNQIANAQFSVVNFAGQYNVVGTTNPAPINIAPGWVLDLSSAGTGNVTVTQIPLNDAVSNPTNAPYALHIALTGFANQGVLRQRFQQNGMNWANQNVASSFTARTTSGSPILLAQLVASNGSTLALLSTSTLTNSFAEYQGHATLTTSTNADLPPNAYIDFKLFMPGSCDIYLTSFQLVLTSTPENVAYEQETIDRQLDFLAHYYKPLLAYKPIPSYLVGWDFPKNPSQANGDTVAIFAGANQAQYFWDQTIIYQTLTNGVSGARAANGGLILTSHGAGQIAVIQYLDQIEARKILSDRASVNMFISASVAIPGTVSLWATTDTNLPTLPNAFITALNANGLPTAFNTGNWVQVPNLYQNNTFTAPLASATNSESNDIMLNGWDLQGAVPANTATFFAIVIGFSAWANNNTITFNSVSLCPGDIATRPAPKTLDETLRDCERYYEKSYAASVIPGTATTNDQIMIPQMSYKTMANFFFQNVGFGVNYKVEKRTAAPTFTFYIPSTGTANSLTSWVFDPGTPVINSTNAVVATYWTPVATTKNSITLNPNGSLNLPAGGGGVANASNGSGWITFHYSVDARLGVVN